MVGPGLLGFFPIEATKDAIKPGGRSGYRSLSMRLLIGWAHAELNRLPQPVAHRPHPTDFFAWHIALLLKRDRNGDLRVRGILVAMDIPKHSNHEGCGEWLHGRLERGQIDGLDGLLLKFSTRKARP